MELRYSMQTFLTIDGINQGNMIMQSHDIVYITPNFNLGSEIIQDINSVFSFISYHILSMANHFSN